MADDEIVLARVYPVNMLPTELAAFVQALSALRGARAHIEDDALVWSRKRPGPRAQGTTDDG